MTKAANSAESGKGTCHALPGGNFRCAHCGCTWDCEKCGHCGGANELRKQSTYETYPHRESKAIAANLQSLRRQADDANMAATKSAYAVVSTLDKVAAYFRDPTSVPFTVAQHNAKLAFGPRAMKLMQKVATDKTVLKRYRDEISTKNAQLLNHPVDWTAAPYSLIKDALDAVDTFAEQQTKLASTKEAVAENRDAILRPFAVERSASILTGSCWRDEPKQAALDLNVEGGGAGATGGGFFSGTGAGVGSRLAGLAADTVKNFAPKGKNQLVDEALDKLSDPEHEDKLRAIRVQGMMHEMMASDPIISGYPYRDTLKAYNHLAEVAPRAMQTRVMAQAMLRRYLEQSQSLDPFDAGQMLDVNEKLTKNDMPESLAKGGWRVGPMRSLGKPAPSQSMTVPAPAAESDPLMKRLGTLGAAADVAAPWGPRAQPKSDAPSKPSKPSKPKK